MGRKSFWTNSFDVACSAEKFPSIQPPQRLPGKQQNDWKGSLKDRLRNHGREEQTKSTNLRGYLLRNIPNTSKAEPKLRPHKTASPNIYRVVGRESLSIRKRLCMTRHLSCFSCPQGRWDSRKGSPNALNKSVYDSKQFVVFYRNFPGLE